MSDDSDSIYYQQYQEKVDLTPDVRLWVCFANLEKPVRGTIINIHGLFGSPLEQRQTNLIEPLTKRGFNVVSLETIPLSLTADYHTDKKTYLDIFHKSLRAGFYFISQNSRLFNVPHKFINAHSIACRALVNLMYDDNRNKFDSYKTIILNNPYFVPTNDLLESSKTNKWDRIKNIRSNFSSKIMGTEYNYKICANGLLIPPADKKLQNKTPEQLADAVIKNISNIYPKHQIVVIQGTGDDKTLKMNMKILPKKNKQIKIKTIKKADHNFSNTLQPHLKKILPLIDDIDRDSKPAIEQIIAKILYRGKNK
ncbi:MAG: hypothetical protein LBL75_02390 [Rickettsiales bacterium]|jgi:hypothetical protein|nr:hypothetical protein [Rickettsiales bacterium]